MLKYRYNLEDKPFFNLGLIKDENNYRVIAYGLNNKHPTNSDRLVLNKILDQLKLENVGRLSLK